MKIIKRGQEPPHNPGEATCGYCGTNISFDSADIQRYRTGKWRFDWDAGEDVWQGSGGYDYVRCPVCSRKIEVMDMPKPRYFQL